MARSDEPDSDAQPPLTAARRLIAGLLLVVGVQLWLLIDLALVRSFKQLLLIAAIIGVSLVPQVWRSFGRASNWLNRRRGAWVALIAILLGTASCVYFCFTAARQERPFYLTFQDEFSYHIQAQMLARGRLWMPPHPLADFFDSFYLIVDPVYGSMYFPGTAMMLTPGIWLGAPTWLTPLVLGGLTIAMTYLLFRELLDGTAGVLAAIFLVGLPLVRMLSILSLSAMPALLLGITLLWSVLRFIAAQDRGAWGLGWLMAIGVTSGWLAITRPVDALCYAVPGWTLLLWVIRAQTWQQRTRAVALALAAVAPFLMLQLVFNRGVTGQWFKTPFGYYTERDYPGVAFGFPKRDPDARPASIIPQKQQHYRQTVAQLIEEHRLKNVPRQWLGQRGGWLFRENLPDPLLAILLPAGLLAVTGRARYVALVAILPVFVLLYSAYTFFNRYYYVTVAPVFALLVLLAALRVLPELWHRHAPMLRTMLALLIAGVTGAALPEFHRTELDNFFYITVHPRVNEALARLPQTPAVVLFRYHPRQTIEEEPVYNAGVAWPDDAKIIRAHDLGERNIEIFRYYAQRQPDRAFYIYDRADDSILFLGMAGELARREQ